MNGRDNKDDESSDASKVDNGNAVAAAEFQRLAEEAENSQDLAAAIQLLRERREAKALYEEVRVLCWVPIAPASHNVTAVHVRATWGKRCNKLIFISTKDGNVSQCILSKHQRHQRWQSQSIRAFWNKTRSALKYIYSHFLNDYEWFLKADDNTFVLLENLRYLLRAYDTNDPVYFGQHYKTKSGYNSGGGGYVLGREAVRRFIEKAFHNESVCNTRKVGEDFQLGRCLQGVGIAIIDTRDHLQQGRFFQQHVRQILQDPNIHQRLLYYPVKKDDVADSCCSDTVISFHQMTTADLYMLDYLIYKVRVFGHVTTLPLKIPLPPDLAGIPKKTIESYL
ncbi:glycoprotein-N-acetylgalactosamine 3-beta-galactosyltransferase 1-like [Penaeus japonicus]|uniref:glycoprotein-N-acetylgalactosamine 3-beta-galactosyltransferase 1-like n=1 Tax=Penaeus japonicus TaxID=27405 RepID=UPI001C71063D|nr:glycoprotein-N-acetylgalactosamine 3-beta-galactosyltransferase 1-like [Penaeus japonicus]